LRSRQGVGKLQPITVGQLHNTCTRTLTARQT